MKLNRADAMNLRKKLMTELKTNFKLESHVEIYTNVMTHSNILWQTWNNGQKFCGFDAAVRPLVRPEQSLFTQYTAEMLPFTKSACEFLVDVLKRELSIETLEFVEGTPKVYRPEKRMQAVVPDLGIEVRYFTHDDANGWGRPEFIVTIPFE